MAAISEIQDQLKNEGLDGWLFVDHHVRDHLAYRILGITAGHVSRRWYYFIPAQGEPKKLVHQIEAGTLEGLPGSTQKYASWQEQQNYVAGLLDGVKTVAMQYSEKCMIPYISLVDGGTIELVRSTGTEVVSSAGLVQLFEARWSAEQLEMHLEAGRRIDRIRASAFELIGEAVRKKGEIDEFTVAQYIRAQFAENELVTSDGPIVGVNGNSGDPHYMPSEGNSALIREGDFVLIDLWAKLDRPKATYYDVTWTGFCGSEVPEKIQKVFEVVIGSRDAAVEAVNQAISAGNAIHGFEVDDVVRNHIRERGFGDAFIHRTGHSIGEEVHANGANIDNLETHDTRPIIPRTCFSIEPGVYLSDFGVRSEIDCYVSEEKAVATGAVQKEIIRIL